jgi:hypothetical protein
LLYNYSNWNTASVFLLDIISRVKSRYPWSCQEGMLANGVLILTLLTLTLDGDEWVASHTGCLMLGEIALVHIKWEARLICFRKKIRSPAGIEP